MTFEQPSPDSILTLAEVSKALQVSRFTVMRKLIPRDGLPAFYIGNRLRFSRRAFLEWLEQRQDA